MLWFLNQNILVILVMYMSSWRKQTDLVYLMNLRNSKSFSSPLYLSCLSHLQVHTHRPHSYFTIPNFLVVQTILDSFHPSPSILSHILRHYECSSFFFLTFTFYIHTTPPPHPSHISHLFPVMHFATLHPLFIYMHGNIYQGSCWFSFMEIIHTIQHK